MDDVVQTIIRKVDVAMAADATVHSGDYQCVEVVLPATIQPDKPLELYFDGVVSSPYLVGQEGILAASSDPFRLLVAKTSGSFPSEKLKRGKVLTVLSSVVELEVCSSPEADVCLLELTSDTFLDQIDLSDLKDPFQHKAVLGMLLEHRLAFSHGDQDVGHASVTKHKIELYDNTPIRQKPRNFPEPVAKEIEKQCEELLKLNIIDYSKSPWSAPIVPIRKPDGTIRMCIDYRLLNRVTKSDRFPIPNMNSLIYSLHGMQFFTTLDLVRGYYQIGLDRDSMEYTAFSTPRHHYEFKRLSFGLKNAPGAFQREMQHVLSEFDSREVIVYIDDIMIMSRTFEEHLTLVAKVLKTLADYSIKVKLSKCSWFKSEVKFLGHIVSPTGLRKCESHMSTIRNYPLPTTVSELRSFMGLVNYHRKFIPHCASISKPLNCLTGLKEKSKLIWTDEMIVSFNKLREAICMDLELAYPDYSQGAEKLELSTDASGTGAGATLSQVQNGNRRTIAHASMTFSSAQCNYSVIERELAAIRWAVRAFSGFLYGIPFVLFTDHRPLVYMHSMSRLNARLMRTLNELSEFDYELRYLPGKDNKIADVLSHLPSSSVDHLVQSPVAMPAGLVVIRTVPGGGDSLVESLFEVLMVYKFQHNSSLKLPNSVSDLRNELVREILARPLLYKTEAGTNSIASIKLMRIPGQAPSELFLLAFANLYSLQVLVHYEMSSPVVFKSSCPVINSSKARVHLQCLAGVHYNPLCETDAYSLPEKPHIPFQKIASDGEEEEHLISTASTPVWFPCQYSHSVPYSCKVPVLTHDETLCAIFDTGSQVSLITASCLKCLSVTPDTSSPPLQIRSFGHILSSLGKVDLDISFPSTPCTWTLSFFVVEDSTLSCCLLVGADALRQLHAQIDYSNHGLTLPCGDESHLVSFVTHVPNPKFRSSHYCFAQDSINGLLDHEQVILVQQADPVLKQLLNSVMVGHGRIPWDSQNFKPFKRYLPSLKVRDGLLFFQFGDKWIPVVSFQLLIEITMHLHYQRGHPGRNKLHHAVQNLVWHPLIHQVVADVCLACVSCQCNKVSAVRPAIPVIKIRASRPFQLVAADLVLLPKTRLGHIGCLVVVDHCSKWLSCVPIRNKSAKAVINAFEHRVLPGLPLKPSKLLTDNGLEFTNTEFEGLLGKYGISHVYSSPYRPSSNGAVERTNRTILEILRCLGGDSTLSWDTLLAEAVINYNASWHSQLAMSPSSFLLSQSHDITDTPALPTDVTNVWKEGHPNFSSFHIGDQVLRKSVLLGHRVSNKMVPRYSGPFTITKVRSNGLSYEISCGNNKIGKVHHAQLRRFFLSLIMFLQILFYRAFGNHMNIQTHWLVNQILMILEMNQRLTFQGFSLILTQRFLRMTFLDF